MNKDVRGFFPIECETTVIGDYKTFDGGIDSDAGYDDNDDFKRQQSTIIKKQATCLLIILSLTVWFYSLID